jgi:hypothetical protein
MHPALRFLPQAQVYRIDDVVTYGVHHFEDLERIDFTQDIPNVAPLAPAAWFEWDAQSQAGHVIKASAQRQRSGVLALSADLADEDPERKTIDPRWHSRFLVMSQLHDGTVCWQRGSLDLLIGPGGQPRPPEVWPDPTVGEDGLRTEEIVTIMVETAFCALATCFAHCKGVQMTEHHQSRQQRRARERQGQPPLVRFRTVDIRPVTRLLREQGQVDQIGLRRALHMVRGHFATYTEDAPLFGHYVGTVYRRLHVRGQDRERVALHDYRVRPPQHAESVQQRHKETR